MSHVVVVGSGIAGLIAALEISRSHDVTLVTKSRLAESNTRYAQGGIAAATFRDDSAAEHMTDTLRAGAGLCDVQAVRVLCSEGPARVQQLVELGVEFDTVNGEFARGLEAAHGRARVLHAGGDATGLNIEMALVEAIQRARNVLVLEHTFACDVVMRDGAVAGVDVLRDVGDTERIAADAVVLASGGAGQLFAHTTNPAVATGDGVAMAWRAGARLADVEFYQFHPTLLATPGAPFLISEAVRGEGATLLDAHGRRFMQGLHEAAELAPRDVVARGIARQMALQNGTPVLLDATALGASFLRKRFPTIDAACRERGVDWSKEPIPVTPAAHYWMGGVHTDLYGRTNVRGLFAIGEAACTGVHGANRLASNSLLESLVFASRCAELIASAPSVAQVVSEWPEATGKDDDVVIEEAQLNAVPSSREVLQAVMFECVGIQRSKEGLVRAGEMLAWRCEGGSVGARETNNLLTLARLMVRTALAREESRGAHWREDFPATSQSFAHSQRLVMAADSARSFSTPSKLLAGRGAVCS